MCSPLSSVFYGTIKSLTTMVDDIAGSKRRHEETMSQVALLATGCDTKVVAGLKRRHRKNTSQVTLFTVVSDTKVIAGSNWRHRKMCVQVELPTVVSDANIISNSKRRHSEAVSQVSLAIVSRDAKNITTNICLLDKLALTNVQNHLISIDLSFDSSYLLMSIICVVSRFTVSHLEISAFTTRLLSILEK